MSAKNRGKTPNAHAFYATDPRLVSALLRRIDAGEGPPLVGLNLPPDPLDPLPVWCDPCAGDGAIVRAVESYRTGGRTWLTSDIRKESEAAIIGDFRDPTLAGGAEVYITNPPFTDDEEGGPERERDLMLVFAKGCVERGAEGSNTMLLLPFGFFTAIKRLPFLATRKWDVWPLSPRPSFGLNKHGKKGTDASHYVWVRTGPGVDGRFWPTIDWRRG